MILLGCWLYCTIDRNFLRLVYLRQLSALSVFMDRAERNAHRACLIPCEQLLHHLRLACQGHVTQAHLCLQPTCQLHLTRTSHITRLVQIHHHHSIGFLSCCRANGRPVVQGLTPRLLAFVQVLFAVFKGRRLEMPDHAPSGFAALVKDCMAQKPAERPSFPQIQLRIAALQADHRQ